MADFFVTDEPNEGILLYYEMWQRSTLGDEYRFGGNYCLHVQGSYIPEYRYLDIHLRENLQLSQAGSLWYDTQFQLYLDNQVIFNPAICLYIQHKQSIIARGISVERCRFDTALHYTLVSCSQNFEDIMAVGDCEGKGDSLIPGGIN